MVDVGEILNHARNGASALGSSRLGRQPSPDTDLGRLAVDDAALHAWIVEHIDAGRFVFTDHALTRHPFAEGFTPRQAPEALRDGRIIERRDDHHRCLISGRRLDLLPTIGLVGSFIHCVVNWAAPAGIVTVRMYRPRTDRWLSETTRRLEGEQEREP